MQRTCSISGESFEISPEEEAFFTKMNLPLPILSPKLRRISLLAFRNERNLYKRTCDLSKKPMISIYPPSAPYPVYEYQVWSSDAWTPPSIPFDPKKDFFEQYRELQKITPRVNSFSPYNENSEYVNAAEKCKNCYMVFVTDRCEDCLYLDTSFASKDCADLSYSHNSTLCYESSDLKNCYHARFSYLCENCSDVSFCFDMRGCQDCFMSSGLQNQQYCIFNQPYSKEDYLEKMRQVDLSSFKVVETLKERFFKTIMPGSYQKILNGENCDGNFLINCKNCHQCFDIEGGEDCLRVTVGANGIKDVHDTHAVVDGSELIYLCVSVTEGYNCHNVIGCWTSKNSCYSEFLQGCSDCIGCISLRRKKYCILNQQYSKEDYEQIKSQIKEQLGDRYGSPFPLSLAPFSYQDSAYRDYQSLSKEDVEKIGWRYGEERIDTVAPENALSVDQIPDRLDDFTTDHLKNIYRCEQSGKGFKIIEQELKLLKKIVAPIPRRQHDVRFLERTKQRKVFSFSSFSPSHVM